ncbi:hypothetical protein KQ247_08910 [Ruegeria pomeroyi]|uniref:Translocase n=2 Tax=Ruegeria pomeroyi TaxID=89184 RepID=Q5LWK1_RUEPO|nr:hypothetical protein [Ruegeria pomeroyi]HCE70360.1 hypothetical protein [Ruegeria sp.]AAV93387.2 hypothetical protein SPO0056 [Ruegeria pomeroyi DSS-3]NVK99668.1 hypothetical protein [Ruegeria pomeroyi]NVL02636.1 hypothetical protein [Ruegeria pomeroyi]QWV10683.1 hypothetical protein KQ247_08910 [Ruegeria pomeroyi]
MAQRRKILTAGGTVLCAALIGFLMQQNAARETQQVAARKSFIQQSVLKPSGASDVDDFAQFELHAIKLTSAQPALEQPRRLPEPALEGALPLPARDILLPDAPSDPEEPQLGCAIIANAAPAPMASVALDVSAPCYGNQRVTVHHSGLIFTDTTDDAGTLSVTVPALSETAVFVVAFQNGRGAVAMSPVEGLDRIDRVVVQWSGAAGFQLHAREFGAGYGETGHVWSQSTDQGIGQVIRLGEPDTLEPQLAEIYSYPNGESDTAGTITLSIEAEVTATNCGRDISAQSLELRGAGSLTTHDLDMSMPDCSAAGDFLVLNNLVEDLKIAAR